MTEIPARRFAAVLFAMICLTGCSKGAATAEGKAATAKGTQPTGDPFDLGRGYTSASGTAIGAVTGTIMGTVKLDGEPATTPYQITKDQAVCGTVASSAIQVSAKTGGLANTVVWIVGVNRGKQLPIDKRVDLASDDCDLDPRVQAATSGSTVDIVNDDKLLHRLVFLRLGTQDTLTVTPFFNAGQMVASERIAKSSAIVEVRCAQHPWTRAYIAVFDHPYFAVTKADGTFTIDSVPPGAYKVMAWHEGMAKPSEQPIQIAAGAAAAVALSIKLSR